MTIRTKLFYITLASMLLSSLVALPVQGALSVSRIPAAKSAGGILLPARLEQAGLQNALNYPTDPTADIPWSGGTSGVADIQAAFNNARTAENSQLGSAIPMLTLPGQTEWVGSFEEYTTFIGLKKYRELENEFLPKERFERKYAKV